MATGAVVARILTQYSDKGSKQAQKDIKKLGKDIDAFGKKASKAFGLAAAATVALAVKIGKDSVQAAIEDSKSQAILASALQKSTGATSEAINAVEDYISKQQMLTNVQDSELRASLQSLVIATGDVTEAQRLQTIALDVAAATGNNLEAVTIGLVRAQQGNVNSLKKLSPEISGLITKTTKAEDVFSLLGATYEGSAKKLAEQDPIKSIQIQFGEIAEQIGFALLPAVQQFAAYMRSDLIPTFQEFIKLNEDKITKNILGLADAIETLVKRGAGIAGFLIEYRTAVTYILGTLATLIAAARTLVLLSAALAILKTFKSIKIGISLTRGSVGAMKEMFTFTKAMSFIVQNAKNVATAIGLITTAFYKQGIAAGVAAIATAFATAGVSVGLAATALAAVGVTALATKNALDVINKKELVHTDILEKQLDITREGYAEIVKTTRAKEEQDRLDKIYAADLAKAAKIKAKQAGIEAKNLELRNRIEKKYGLKLTDQDTYEIIQLKAVEMLQQKQKVADLALLERIKARKEEVLLFEALNQNAEKYTDLLKVLSDQVISSDEIAVLAKKWGMTTDAVTSYIFTIFAIKDTVVSSAEVKVLADSWGITIKQAEQYLDFFSALNDGKLSETEIIKLMSKWMLTRTEASKYADFVSKIGDGKLDDSEITKLKSAWGLTTQEVVAYIVKIGGKVDASGTILSAGDIAALGWTNALTALQKYLNAQAKGTGGAVSTGTGPDLESLAANAARLEEVRQKLLALQEKVQNTVKIPDDEPVQKTVMKYTEEYLNYRTGERGYIAMANGGIVNSPTQALIGEAGAEAVIPLNRIGSILSSLTNSDGIGSSRSNTTNVTVNVAGSVTSQNDLVAAIRNGLLRGQTNGQGLTLQAI